MTDESTTRTDPPPAERSPKSLAAQLEERFGTSSEVTTARWNEIALAAMSYFMEGARAPEVDDRPPAWRELLAALLYDARLAYREACLSEKEQSVGSEYMYHHHRAPHLDQYREIIAKLEDELQRDGADDRPDGDYSDEKVARGLRLLSAAMQESLRDSPYSSEEIAAIRGAQQWALLALRKRSMEFVTVVYDGESRDDHFRPPNAGSGPPWEPHATSHLQVVKQMVASPSRGIFGAEAIYNEAETSVATVVTWKRGGP